MNDWKEEAQLYAHNAEYWRDKYEETAARIRELEAGAAMSLKPCVAPRGKE